MQDISFKSNSGQFNIDEAQGIVECFVAGIGNKDSVGDIVVTGAFAKSLIRRKPRVVWGHNWNDPIGKVLEIYEVAPNDPRLPQKMKAAGIGGLYAKVQFNLNSEKGKEAFANVAFFGEEQEWSIGYKTLDAIFDNSRQANVLREVELYELSPVLHGANQLTGTISVKSDEKSHGIMPMGALVLEDKPEEPRDPFAQGLAQPLSGDKLIALTNELSERTGGPVKVMKANESSIVFLKPGKGLFRLGYYFDGEQYMFGKPEKLSSPIVVQPTQGMNRMPNGTVMPNTGPRAQRVPNFPNVQAKPSVTEPSVPVKYGADSAASGFFDLDDEKSLADANEASVVEQISGIIGSLQNIVERHQMEKSAFLIPCKPQHAFETKQALDPVFDYHRIETYVTEDGIVIASPLNGDAYEAVENATKSLLGRIGRGIGGGGKVRRGRAALSRIQGVLDPRKRRDVDGDGLIFDNTWREMPDPTRFVASARPIARLASGRGDDDAPTKPEGPVLSGTITVPKTTKPRIMRMFNEVIEKNKLGEDSAIFQVAQRFQNSKLPRTGANDYSVKIEKDLLDRAQAEYETLRGQFEEAGGHRISADGKKEKGRTAFDVIDEVMKTGGYIPKLKGRKRKTDKVYVRGGKAIDKATAERGAGTVGRSDKGKSRAKSPYEELDLPLLKPKPGTLPSDTGHYAPDYFDDWIKKGVLPQGWNEMSSAERYEWWFSKAPNSERSNRDEILSRGSYRSSEGKPKILIDWSVLVGRVQSKIVQDDEDDDPESTGPDYKEVLLRSLERDPVALDKYNENVKKFNKEFNKRQKLLRELNEKRKESGMEPLDELPRNMWPESSLKLESEMKNDFVGPESKPKPISKPKKSSKPKTSNEEKDELDDITAEVVRVTQKYFERNRKDLPPEFAAVVGEVLEKVSDALSEEENEDGVLPLEKAYQILALELRDLNEIRGDTSVNRQKRSQANKMLEGLNILVNHLYQRMTEKPSKGKSKRRGRDEEGELDFNETDEFEALARRGRAADRRGLGGDDDDVESGADLDEVYGDDSTDDGYEVEDFGYEDDDSDEQERFSSGRRMADPQKAVLKAQKFQKRYAAQRQGMGRLASGRSSNKPCVEISEEATWWQGINNSLDREIRSASSAVADGLELLRQKIADSKAPKYRPGGKRTNVASIRVTASEADQILDAVMAVIDRQKSAGKGGTAGSRGELFAELLEKIASQALSTFIDKTSTPAN